MEGVFKQPNSLKLDGNMNENWLLFYQVFGNYLVASGLDAKTDKVKCAVLLQCLGEDCISIYNSFSFANEEEKTNFRTLKDKFKQHCQPRKNVTYDRHIFFTTKQAIGESIDVYITDLKNKAKQCEFADLQDSLIRDQIMCGIRDNAVRLRLLREPDLTLQKTIDICRASELSEAQLKILNTVNADVNVNAVQYRHKPRPAYKQPTHSANNTQHANPGVSQKQAHRPTGTTRPGTCPNCLGSHKFGRCPAYGQTCHHCQRQNHFKVACRKRRQFAKPVHTVMEDDFSELFIGTVENNASTRVKDWTINVHVNDNPLVLKIDTGAQTNVLNIQHYKQITNVPLEKCSTYSGHTIETLGKCILALEHRDRFYPVEFVVADTKSASVIGLDSSVQLNLVKKLCSVSKTDDILSDYSDLFSGLGELPVSYHIEIDKNIPSVIAPARKIPIALKSRVKQELKRMEDSGVIKRVDGHTPWVSNMVTVTKPDKIRICMDPKNLNKAIKREHHPMKTVEEVASDMPNAKFFSVLDAQSGFWQIPIDEESSRLCTFASPFGRYSYRRLPFGINSAPEIFQSIIQQEFGDLEGTEVIVNDLLIWGETREEHDQHLRAALDRCREKILRLNKTKCKIGLNEIKYVGHTLSSSGLKPDPEKVKAVVDMPVPDNKQALQRFLGMLTYLSKFIEKFSEITAPLRELLEKEIVWHWDEPQQTSFEKLKMLASTTPVLRYFDVNKETTHSVDASSKGLGTTILQQEQPVAYASRAMTKTQERYAQIEKEMFAIVFGYERFHQYLYGNTFIVETDHKPLVSIFKKPLLQAPARLQAMLLRLQKYDFSIIYKPGKKLIIADTLSRAFQTDKSSDNSDLEICLVLPASNARLREIEQETTSDLTLQMLRTTVLDGWPESRDVVPACILPYWNHRDELLVYEGIIFKGQKIVIPPSLRPSMIAKVHSSHLGMTLCKSRACDVIFWPGMCKDIEDSVSKCRVCNEKQYSNPKEHYLILVDYYSGFFEISQLADMSSRTTITHIKSHLARHGIPDEIISDNGPQYSSHEFKQFSEQYRFKHTTSSPCHPRANGMAEKSVQIAKRLLSKAKRDRTDPYLALLAYRNTPRGELGSPAQRLFSRRTRTLLLTSETLLQPQLDTDVQNKLTSQRQLQKQYYDRQSKPLPQLQPCEIIRYQGEQRKDWKQGVVESTARTPRSYNIRTPEGRTLRRNRVFLRRSNERLLPPKPSVEEMDIPLVSPEQLPIASSHYEPTTKVPTHEPFVVPNPCVTSCGRQVKVPIRFRDYVA